jgi:hypothetical protein
LFTLGTIRHTSTNHSSDGSLVAGSMSRTFEGSGKTIRMRPFWRRSMSFSRPCSGCAAERQAIVWRVELGYSIDDIARRLGGPGPRLP